MEVDNLVLALEKTLSLLRKSDSSDRASLSVEEIVRQLETELDKARNSQLLDLKKLRYLYAPTCSLQEISIDNGWGKEFIEIADVVDLYTSH